MSTFFVGRNFICRRCLGLAPALQPSRHILALFSSEASSKSPVNENQIGDEGKQEKEKDSEDASKELGPMARRLEEVTEETLFTGGAAGRRAIEDAGFSDELKEKLFDKIANANFRSENAGAFAEAEMSPAAGQGTRLIATGKPWTGQEDTADAVLRMLDDAKKPLGPGSRGKFELPVVDMRLKRGPARSPGQRAANARDLASKYTGMGMKSPDEKGLSDKEKEAMRKEFKERFQPASRAMPNSITGLAALANERIENAIARGQFKDLPRGKAMERDPRADNPFVDTTEYIMNKMIQRQDIVPPWIEKQQELARAARVFRARLRNDWKRHAARMIAARGGGLDEQVRRAREYAAAEKVWNPRRRASDEIAVSAAATDDVVMGKVRERVEEVEEKEGGGMVTEEKIVKALGEAVEDAVEEVTGSETLKTEATPASSSEPTPEPSISSRPFRDPDWERTENAYMTLSITNMNSIARSYNLMAPDLAKKPYFSLQRELLSCYAEVAPLIPDEIRERALRPRRSGLGSGTTGQEAGAASIFERLAGGRDNVRIHLEAEEKAYGLKEWWRDFWKKEG